MFKISDALKSLMQSTISKNLVAVSANNVVLACTCTGCSGSCRGDCRGACTRGNR